MGTGAGKTGNRVFGAAGACLAAAWGARGGMGSGRWGEGLGNVQVSQMPCEGTRDQVLITCLLAGVWKFPGETVSRSLLGVTRAVPVPPLGGGSEHSVPCSLSPRHPCTTLVPKLPVPPSLRTAQALRVPEPVRKSTSTGTDAALRALLPLLLGRSEARGQAWQRHAEGPEAPGQLVLPWAGPVALVLPSPCGRYSSRVGLSRHPVSLRN